MARLFIIDERIFNVLPRDVANRIGSPDIRVDTGPLQPLTELVEAIRQRLATGAHTPPGPPVPAPRQGRATTLPSARPTAGLLRISHLFIAAHGSSGHLQLTPTASGSATSRRSPSFGGWSPPPSRSTPAPWPA